MDYLKPELLESIYTNKGNSLAQLNQQNPILLVFLRHFGCVFCKEALTDIAQLRKQIEGYGIQIIFVHMASKAVADDYFERYQLQGIQHVSDPDSSHYRSFGIEKGSFSQLYGMRTWIRGFAAKQQGHALEIAKELGSTTQMPGLFMIQDGKIMDQYLHQYASDRPDYLQLIQCCINTVKADE